MLDNAALSDCLETIGLSDWATALRPVLQERMSATAHGDFPRWQAIVNSLTDAGGDQDRLKQLLLELSPWRKGPWQVDGVNIDAEWRSDLKWARLQDAIAPLADRCVLDVGCGNGYYAFQMRNAGARAVIGVDPTLLFVMQFLAVNTFIRDAAIFVLPVRLQELPLPAARFDTVFSMGVLYHQRSPIDHLQQLRAMLRPGGQLVLETIYLPGDEPLARTPEDRYARMHNVWALPTISELTAWMTRSGYRDICVVDQSITTTDEQRSTEWMTFESLRDALDPEDASRTVEGWPAPHRVVVTATSPL